MSDLLRYESGPNTQAISLWQLTMGQVRVYLTIVAIVAIKPGVIVV